MANIVFKYSTFCIVSLFIGIGLCTPRQMILYYGSREYAAWGIVDVGNWETGHQEPESKGMSSADLFVLLNRWEEFEPHPGKKVSIDDNGIVTGEPFSVTIGGVANISIVFEEPTNEGQPTIQALVAGKEKQWDKQAIVFGLLKIEMAKDCNFIKCTISPGDSHQPYPDASVQNSNGQCFLGYKKTNNTTNPHIRVLGAEAEKFNVSNVPTNKFTVSDIYKNNSRWVTPLFTGVLHRKNEFVVEISIRNIGK